MKENMVFDFSVNPKKSSQLKVRRKLDIPISWKGRIGGVIKAIKAQKTRMESFALFSEKRFGMGLRIFSSDISFQDCFSQLCQPVLHCRCQIITDEETNHRLSPEQHLLHCCKNKQLLPHVFYYLESLTKPHSKQIKYHLLQIKNWKPLREQQPNSHARLSTSAWA